MHNLKLIIAYDGTHYLGWQKTRMGQSIEAALQKTLEQILQHPIHLQAASRTDAGVHADGQVVNFLTTKTPDLFQFQISLNSLLPKDIVVLNVEEMPPSFHPTLDCKGKEYHYYISHGPTQRPQHRFYAWHVPYALNLSLIQEAIPTLIGTHDFAAFCNFKNNAHYADTIRRIDNLNVEEFEDHRILFKIEGNHFLYKMVRNIVGTLISVGRGKIGGETIPQILQSKLRTQAGMTAPAHGLFLKQVFY